MAIAMAALTLVGWALSLDLLKSLLPGLSQMKANTAVAITLAGVALWIPRGDAVWRTRAVVVAASLITAIGVLTFTEYVTGWDFHIDQLLFPDHATLHAPYPGRMGVNTALAFMLLGTALLPLVNVRPAWRVIREACALASGGIAGTALLGYAFANPGQLHQVIMNLVVNARDAMPTGGTITIETSNADLSEQYTQAHQLVVPGRYVMLAVTDTGIGMTPAVQARIFEPFFTTKEEGKGTGLGLATVYGIVKQSGGYIFAYSEPGLGTTFKIYLPQVHEAAVPGPDTGAAEVRGGSETVLLVEDAAAVRDAARRGLERRGYAVLEAAGPTAALLLAEQHAGRIDLLLTDVVMPDMNGGQLAERLTALRPGLKVLYMSGYTGDAALRQGVIEGDVAYLQKPFTPDGLARKVRDVLDAA